MTPPISDSLATKYPVSVKGVLFQSGRVLLLENDRQEWELPGGKLDRGETLPSCLARELSEETGLEIAVDRLLHAYIYPVAGIVDVLIVAYLCSAARWNELRISSEHRAMRLFGLDELASINLPDGYRHTIALARADAGNRRDDHAQPRGPE